MQDVKQETQAKAVLKSSIQESPSGSILTILISGIWLNTQAKSTTKIKQEIIQQISTKEKFSSIRLQCENLQEWDVTFLAFITHIAQLARSKKIPLEISTVPEKAKKLLTLALEVAPRDDMQKEREDVGLFEYIGEQVLETPENIKSFSDFLTNTIQALGQLFKGKSKMYSQDLWLALQECGINALPIVSLMSLLLGLILAFVGALQLELFGAEVYIASLVGLSMVRIMGALLTGIVLAGRTGANFAAIIGTMQVNEEVDALETFGISPYEFLVLPRVIALTLMAPFLTLYADIMGIIGGFLVGVIMLDIAPVLYIENTLMYMDMTYVWVGLFHGLVFGFLIAVAGCYQGMLCGRSAEAVGQATTAAVVNSLIGIIVGTSILTIIFTIFGI